MQEKKKRIAVERKFVFIIKKMLELVEEMEMEIIIKKMYKQPQKDSIQDILKNEKNKILKNENNNSNSDCIILKLRK